MHSRAWQISCICCHGVSNSQLPMTMSSNPRLLSTRDASLAQRPSTRTSQRGTVPQGPYYPILMGKSSFIGQTSGIVPFADSIDGPEGLFNAIFTDVLIVRAIQSPIKKTFQTERHSQRLERGFEEHLHRPGSSHHKVAMTLEGCTRAVRGAEVDP